MVESNFYWFESKVRLNGEFYLILIKCDKFDVWIS